MKVVFDGACLRDQPITGVGRAFLNGVAAYAKAHGACTLLVPEGAPAPAMPGVEELVAIVTAPRGAFRRQLLLPRLLRRLQAEVLHSSVASVPLRAPCPTIATAHDLPWLHPELGEATTARQRLASRRALASADAVIAPSTFTADDVRRCPGVDMRHVFVIPHGTLLGAAPDAASVAARHGPLLVLGDDRPRKNRERVRAAYALAKTNCPALPPLRFVGPPDDYVDEATKLELLRDCRAVVQCSLFEGFGMPVLEALAHGAPLLCSDIPPHREIARSQALFVDPRSVSSIEAGLIAIHRDASMRNKLAAGGWQLARAFAPAVTAERWFTLHQEVHRRHREAGPR
ncbi:MAG: glycosyltransferase family 4 protein [Planctomycetes bacterium]|nr:glycosyltransferase family 4 protein [Planctomycetota bacterium]